MQCSILWLNVFSFGKKYTEMYEKILIQSKKSWKVFRTGVLDKRNLDKRDLVYVIKSLTIYT